ncbi:MAG: DoxX family membrane protein [Candidatus Planktophila sp.]|jgi:uncharacterized membrane protein YphA (DoxX/SURF4 family)|nr:DoxX family membrane protein [Candidatus Planktophila sp.]
MSKFEKLQPWIGLVCRLTLGGVLFVAGYLKVDKLEVSQMAVRSYELLPIPLANFLGQTLPLFEVVIGLLLIVGAATRAVAALGGFTMFIFIIAIAQAWARGLNIDCGCFGGGGTVAPGETRYLQEILRDAGLVAMALFLIRYPVSKFSIDKAPKQSNAGDTE